MNQDLSRPSWVANELAGTSVAAGVLTALITLGIAWAIARLLSLNGRQRSWYLGTLAVLALPVGYIPGWHATDSAVEPRAHPVVAAMLLRDRRWPDVRKHKRPVHIHPSRTTILYPDHPLQHE
jgi:hypothetical protein